MLFRWMVLCVFAGLGVFVRHLASGAKRAEGQVSRKDAKPRGDAKGHRILVPTS